jgi:hypothetical protein
MKSAGTTSSGATAVFIAAALYRIKGEFRLKVADCC